MRAQSPSERLTKASWERLRGWVDDLGITKRSSTLAAALVLAAIGHTGKIGRFRRTFARTFVPGSSNHIPVLVKILMDDPILMPSFSMLEDNLQRMVVSALRADFNMAQFLQAECLTRSLLSLKDDLCQHDANSTILGLSLFRTFAVQCGLLGTRSLEGSLFMTEKLCNQFLMGLDALKLLHEGPHSVYNRYLADRTHLTGLNFHAEDQGSYSAAGAGGK